MLGKLPKGWEKATLADICARIATIQPEDSPDTEFTYFDIGGIDNQSNRIVETRTFSGWEAPSRARQSVRKDDILFSTVRTYLRNIARIEQDYPNTVASTGFTVLRAAEGVLSRFLFSQVLSEDFLQRLLTSQSGSSYPAVRDKDVFAQPIRLAPAREQERIVAKLDALMSQVAAGASAARRALNRLQRYRAAVLHAAVTGELTRDWRSTHPVEETAAQLLKRVLTERRARWEAAELRRLAAGDKPPKDDKWKKRYDEPTTPKTANLPSLPKEWTWTNLSQLKIHSIYGPRFGEEDYAKKGVAVLRTTDIDKRGRVSLDKCPKLPLSKDQYEKYKVEVGDLLITRTGSIGTLAIFNDTVRAIPGAYLLHYRLVYPALVEMAYIFLSSPKGQEHLLDESAGSGRQNLNAPGLEGISIPLPPLQEQKEIIKQVKKRQRAAERLVETLNRQLEGAHATRQSILREAFAGKLVTQDPTDEPASEILKRIRAAREEEGKIPKVKRMPKSRTTQTRPPLLNVLRGHKTGITPEQLFREAGFQPGEVDLFYRELAALRKIVHEKKPRGAAARGWPQRSKVVLELREN